MCSHDIDSSTHSNLKYRRKLAYPRLPSFILSMQRFPNCVKCLWNSHREGIYQPGIKVKLKGKKIESPLNRKCNSTELEGPKIFMENIFYQLQDAIKQPNHQLEVWKHASKGNWKLTSKVPENRKTVIQNSKTMSSTHIPVQAIYYQVKGGGCAYTYLVHGPWQLRELESREDYAAENPFISLIKPIY